MGKYAMAVDLEKCIGCGACIVACKAENRVPPDVFRLTVYELEQGTFPDVKSNSATISAGTVISRPVFRYVLPERVLSITTAWCGSMPPDVLVVKHVWSPAPTTPVLPTRKRDLPKSAVFATTFSTKVRNRPVYRRVLPKPEPSETWMTRKVISGWR